jgi:hypothetical protein
LQRVLVMVDAARQFARQSQTSWGEMGRFVPEQGLMSG